MHTQTARSLHNAFLKNELSAVAITTHFLKRIEKIDGEVGAYLTVFNERALKKAEQLDKKRQEGKTLGKLAAVPIALKDNIHVKGETTTCASKFLTNYKAPFDATVTRLLEQEDAILLGKTNLDEFAMGSSNENSALQKTCNPWHLDCVPGGSSGGSSAAVASGLCAISFGSDTGGSIRQPAALCGIVGLKPTYGRVSRYGLVAFGSSLDQIGPMAHSVEDIALVMEAIAKHDPKDATSLTRHTEEYLGSLALSLEGKKIGVPYDFLSNLGSEAKGNFETALENLKELGATLVPIDLNLLNYAVATYYIIATAEASTNLARFDGIRYGIRSKEAKTLQEVYEFSKHDGYGQEVKKRILLGTYVLASGYQDAYYRKATQVRVKIIDAYEKAFEACDIIATPTSPLPCFPMGAIQDPLQMYQQDTYTIGANLARLPAISVPSGFNPEGKPFGLQLTGARNEDALVVSCANAYEKKAPLTPNLPPRYAD